VRQGLEFYTHFEIWNVTPTVSFHKLKRNQQNKKGKQVSKYYYTSNYQVKSIGLGWLGAPTDKELDDPHQLAHSNCGIKFSAFTLFLSLLANSYRGSDSACEANTAI
jgi:hypothetical protein